MDFATLDLAPCMDCGTEMLPHHREDTPEGTICNADIGKRMKANRDQPEIMGVRNVYYGEKPDSLIGGFTFSIRNGGTGAQRSTR